MSENRIIVVGASAGGVETLKSLVSMLPANFPAPIFIVVHIPSHSISMLPTILTRVGNLPAVHPEDGQLIENGHIYIAPPDKHLLLKDGYLTLTRGARENGHRPAIDSLFRSAARIYRNRTTGVILSGTLDDGTSGLSIIKRCGGVAIVQDPEDAIYRGMPQSAIEHVDVDHILPLSKIAPLLIQLAAEEVQETPNPISDDLKYETDIAEFKMSAVEDEDRPGKPSTYICPECGGSLWEMTGDVLRFRCHVGHAYSGETLAAEQGDALEAALWVALRTLEDNASLTRRLAERARSRHQHRAEARFEQQAKNVEEHAKIVQDVLLNGVWGGHSAIAETDEQTIQAQSSEKEIRNDKT